MRNARRHGDPQHGDIRGRRRRRTLRRGAAVVLVATIALALGALNAVATGGSATVETEAAAGVGRTAATLEASVNPNGVAVTECAFEYGTSEALGESVSCTYLPGELETPVPVEAPLSGLLESSTYYFRIHVREGASESTGAIRSFTTLPTLPTVGSQNPVAVGRTSATLTAVVDPDDSEVTACQFEWGTVGHELDHQTPCSSLPGSGSEPVTVSAPIEGLAESTVYYVRTVVTNGFGTQHSGRGSFETLPSAPRAQTAPNSPFTRTTATLKGEVTPNGSAVESCDFQYGTASVEEHTVPCEQSAIGAGEAPVAVSAAVGGLSEGTLYHYRLEASNARGLGTGNTLSFNTPPYLAKVTIGGAREVTDSSALLKGRVNPQGQTVTECRFEYGPTVALGAKVPCSSLPGGGEGYVGVSAPIAGLSPETGYYARLRVVNASGVSYSGLEPFATFRPGLPPVVKKLSPKKGTPAGGTAVTITGEDLEGAESVRFGETTTTDITADSPFSLTVLSPPGTTGVAEVIVVTAAGESALSSGDRFTYSNPVVSSIEPGEGPLAGGNEVTITGSGFEPGSGGAVFAFGKGLASDVECSSSSSCTAVVPAATKHGTVKVRATVAGKNSKAVPLYTYQP